MRMTHDSENLTLEDVRRLLAAPPSYPGPSRATLWRWQQRGLMPKSIGPGRRLLFRKSEIEAWLASR
jgi:predicted DNA-binding transcriptional regulator AlpA